MLCCSCIAVGDCMLLMAGMFFPNCNSCSVEHAAYISAACYRRGTCDLAGMLLSRADGEGLTVNKEWMGGVYVSSPLCSGHAGVVLTVACNLWRSTGCHCGKELITAGRGTWRDCLCRDVLYGSPYTIWSVTCTRCNQCRYPHRDKRVHYLVWFCVCHCRSMAMPMGCHMTLSEQNGQ